MKNASESISGNSWRCLASLVCVAAVVGAVAGVSGCSKKVETRTVMQVKRDYANKLVGGMEFGESGRIKAASFDDRTLILQTVTIDSDEQVMTARSAEIIVDPSTDTLRLRLHDVTGASTEGEGIAEMKELTTSPIKLGFDAVP